MHTFLLDLWHDLREKRLWPVAALLLVAIAAVPFVADEAGAEPAPPRQPPTRPRPRPTSFRRSRSTTRSVETASNLERRSSQRNPFGRAPTCPKAGRRRSREQDRRPGDGRRTATADADAGSRLRRCVRRRLGVRRLAGGGGTRLGGAGTVAGPRHDSTTPTARTSRFGAAGKAKAMKQVEQLHAARRQGSPRRCSWASPTTRSCAVFTVDTARYEAEGEHECKPTPRTLRVRLPRRSATTRNETTFTTLDGDEELRPRADRDQADRSLDKEDVEIDVPTRPTKRRRRQGASSTRRRAAATLLDDRRLEPLAVRHPRQAPLARERSAALERGCASV